MPQVSFPIADFNQASYFKSWARNNWGSLSRGYTTPSDNTQSKSVVISGLPAGAVINWATINFSADTGLYGGTQTPASGAGVSASPGGTTTISFYWKSNKGGSYPSYPTSNTGDSTNYSSEKTGLLKLTGIYVLVDYSIPYSACTAPSSAGVSPAVSEGDATLAYSGAAGGSSNAITGYEVLYAESWDGINWGAWAALKTVSTASGSGSFAVAVSGSRGNYRKYALRTLGAAGASYYSGWVETGSVRRNSAPSVPTITGPAPGSIIYNSEPRILATVGYDADSHTQAVTASGYTPSSAGNQAVGKKLALRRTAAYSAGSQSVSIVSTDSLSVASGAVVRAFTYATPSWTDTLAAGTTPIKAAHMNELRTAINNIRAYYGMAAYAWAQAITAGSTSLAGWTGHITEMRTAINEVVTLVNGWDTANATHDITLPAWTTISTNKPTAAVINELRSAIPLL